MFTITNRTKQLLIVAKNSGPSIYLAPGEGAVVPRAEIDGNAKVDKLLKTGALSVGEVAPQPPPVATSEPASEDALQPAAEDAPQAKKAKPQRK